MLNQHRLNMFLPALQSYALLQVWIGFQRGAVLLLHYLRLRYGWHVAVKEQQTVTYCQHNIVATVHHLLLLVMKFHQVTAPDNRVKFVPVK